MKKTFYSIIILLFPFHSLLRAQGSWEPQLFVTGYINTIGEYIDLDNWKDADQNIGVGLSEVGLLISYKPIEKLEIKSTSVYTHLTPDIQSCVIEAYGQYTFDERLKISAGKFLTPLSPVNVYFYAPLNPSGTLPMLISHHFLLPQSMAGLQVAGKFGRDLQIGYNVTYGNYTTKGHTRGGIIGTMGYEDVIHINDYKPENEKQDYNLGGSMRLYGNYKNIFSIGLNLFEGTRASYRYFVLDSVGGVKEDITPSKKRNIGLDAHLNLNESIKLNGELWIGNNKTTNLDSDIDVEYKAYYVELIYNIKKFSPFFRYEYVDDIKSTNFIQFPDIPAFTLGTSVESFGGGIAFRPFYEVLIKLDYRHLIAENNDDVVTFIGSVDKKTDYNHYMISTVFSF